MNNAHPAAPPAAPPADQLQAPSGQVNPFVERPVDWSAKRLESQPEASFQAMSADWLERVLKLENSVYEHPWSRGNFNDSLLSGYPAQLITGGSGKQAELIGYFVAMQGVDETHLLNLAVAPQYQGQGWSRLLLDALCLWSRGQGAQWLWLEVRLSNCRAKAVYQHYGFKQVGLRRNYYPEASGGAKGREDAVLMSFAL